jgi:hypothetical protein
MPQQSRVPSHIADEIQTKLNHILQSLDSFTTNVSVAIAQISNTLKKAK